MCVSLHISMRNNRNIQERISYAQKTFHALCPALPYLGGKVRKLRNFENSHYPRVRSMKAILLLFFFGLVREPVMAGVDPVSMKAKVHSVYLSTSPYCASTIQAFEAYAPEFINFLIQPVLGALDNSQNTYDGIYSCMVFKMSERLYFKPAINTGGCALDTEYLADLCPSSGTTTGIDGAVTSCTSAEDSVFLYLSTASTSTTLGTGNPFAPPTALDATAGIQLSSPFIISGTRSGRFVINGTNKITSTGPGNCSLDFPAFSFVND
jgi:hypothetical protein